MTESKPRPLSLESLTQRLREVGLKATKARVSILELLSKEHGPFTVEEIAAKLAKKKRSFDLVTLYRCLAAMENLSLLTRCDFGDGSSRYELHHSHHHHIICRQCQRIQALNHCPFENLSTKFPIAGFTQISHRLEFFGLCDRCA